MRTASEANRAILLAVARALRGIEPSLVFVGGCATGLLLTSVQAQDVRPTRDVDVVAAIASLPDYHWLERHCAAPASCATPMARPAAGAGATSPST